MHMHTHTHTPVWKYKMDTMWTNYFDEEVDASETNVLTWSFVTATLHNSSRQFDQFYNCIYFLTNLLPKSMHSLTFLFITAYTIITIVHISWMGFCETTSESQQEHQQLSKWAWKIRQQSYLQVQWMFYIYRETYALIF
jgi:hypothetical protein